MQYVHQMGSGVGQME